MDNLNEELKELVVRGLKLQDIEPEAIDDETPLFADGLGLDSLDAVELVVQVKKKYGVEIKNMEEGQRVLASINALAEFIRESQNKT